ncbi:MAG: hypothetical protein ACFFCO_08090 [Promethearchaeota archaeon]
MPRCPYCDEELQLKLSAAFISEIDTSYYKTFEEAIERMPFGRGMMRKHLDHLEKNPPAVNILVCASCDRVITAKIWQSS